MRKNCYIAIAPLTKLGVQMKAGCTSGSARERMQQHQSSYYSIGSGQEYSSTLGADHIVYELITFFF